jgi:hypothetical protein
LPATLITAVIALAALVLALFVACQLWECLIAACKAFSLANGKGKGTNDRVIKSLDD